MNTTSEEKKSLRISMLPPVALPAPTQRVVPKTAKQRKPLSGNDKLLRQSCILCLIVLLSIGCYFTISHYFVETVQVVGQSMMPTLQDSNHYLLNRWAFHGRDPQHREVVVIRDPADHGYSVKRIIAVSGESVHFKDGKVFVNDLELHESYLPEDTLTFTYNQAKEQLIVCGKDQYFVLGDNRQKSIDSRAYGPVPRENILGLLMAR
jgi:signal peptidase I